MPGAGRAVTAGTEGGDAGVWPGTCRDGGKEARRPRHQRQTEGPGNGAEAEGRGLRAEADPAGLLLILVFDVPVCDAGIRNIET